jgi:hypothetical protein
MGILSREYYFPASIPLFIQLILVGFIVGLITWFLKYKVKRQFLISTKAKMIVFYIFLVPATIFPSIFYPMAMCCDCFGAGCTMISGVPFPALISGQIMFISPFVLSRILIFETIGFVLNVILYYLIAATIVFLAKFFWKNKKIILGVVIALIILFISIKSLFGEKVYDINETGYFEEGKIYRIVNAPKDYDLFQHAVYDDKIVYMNIGGYTYMDDDIYLLDLKTKETKLLAQDNNMEINVLGFYEDTVVWVSWEDQLGTGYDSQGYINILNISDKSKKRFAIPELYMSVSGVLELDFEKNIIVWDDKLPMPLNEPPRPKGQGIM